MLFGGPKLWKLLMILTSLTARIISALVLDEALLGWPNTCGVFFY